MTVRPAVSEDLDALGALLHEGHQREVLRDIPVDVGKARYMLMQYIVRRSCFAYVSDDVNGALFGDVQQAWYSRALVASDLFFYARDGSGIRLLHDFCQWAIQMGAQAIQMESTSGIEPERVSKLFEKFGLQRVGAVHMRVIDQ